MNNKRKMKKKRYEVHIHKKKKTKTKKLSILLPLPPENRETRECFKKNIQRGKMSLQKPKL
jgi:hypothetical protein